MTVEHVRGWGIALKHTHTVCKQNMDRGKQERVEREAVSSPNRS